MSKRRSRLLLNRREITIGAFALSFGVLAALIGIDVADRLAAGQAHPLTPHSGSSQDRIDIAWLPDTVMRWKPKIEHYSAKYHIDPNLVAIMMTVESGGDPHADSGVAKGLMQITDPTAGDIAHRLLTDKWQTYDLYDPDTSIEFGAAYIRYLVGEVGKSSQGPSWDETVTLVAAGYNGGLTAAYQYRDHSWQGLRDYDKDQQAFRYARFVRVMWQERHDPLSFAYRNWYDVSHGKALVDKAMAYQMK